MTDQLAAAAAATFALDSRDRILHENDPDRSSGPRLFAAGWHGGNLVRLRHDVAEKTARVVRDLVMSAPAWIDANTAPPWLATVTERLGREAPVASTEFSLIYALPRTPRPADPRIVRSGTDAGHRLLARLARDGLPSRLIDAGFVSLADFWTPWCVAEDAGEIAAIAFAARLGPAGAEVGVYTFPGFRGRGLAAAVTRAWSSLPDLGDRALFYSTLSSNLSSQRVATRLGLAQIGAGLRIV